MKNRRIWKASLFCGAVMIIVLGSLYASNSSFKLVYPLVAGGTGSASGHQTLGLPYFPEIGLENVSDLFQDIGWQNVQIISRFLPASDTYQSYSLGSVDFPLVPGEGYLVKMGQTIDYVILGSHDPNLAITLTAGGVGSASGNNLVSIPYHSTAATASDLFAELGWQNVQIISRFLPASDTYQSYSLGSPDFPLVPGEAYMIKMGQTINWTPNHY